jgi:hypothetical protein
LSVSGSKICVPDAASTVVSINEKNQVCLIV